MTVDVHDGHDLGQADEGQTHCAVVVEEGQPVLAGAGGEDQTDGEAKEAGGTCQQIARYDLDLYWTIKVIFPFE